MLSTFSEAGHVTRRSPRGRPHIELRAAQQLTTFYCVRSTYTTSDVPSLSTILMRTSTGRRGGLYGVEQSRARKRGRGVVVGVCTKDGFFPTTPTHPRRPRPAPADHRRTPPKDRRRRRETPSAPLHSHRDRRRPDPTFRDRPRSVPGPRGNDRREGGV